MKVLIGTPISDSKLYCWDKYVRGVKSSNCPVFLVDTSLDIECMEDKILSQGFAYSYLWAKKAMDRVVYARNRIRDAALQGGYDYLMFVDADIMIKPDTVARLLKHNKKVVAAIYYTVGGDSNNRIVHNIEGETDYEQFPLEWEHTGLKEAAQIGFGCTLIHRSVLAKIAIRCNRDCKGILVTGEDYCFSNDCSIREEIPLYVDTDIIVDHRADPKVKWDFRRD